MHGSKKGKSRSKPPAKSMQGEWVSLGKEELEDVILKLSKEGKSPSSIGLILRDQYGVADASEILGKKLTAVLADKGVAPKLPEDLGNLVKRAVNLRKHMEKHSRDKHNKRGLALIEAKIHRLSGYYKDRGKLPADYRYDPEQARLEVGR